MKPKRKTNMVQPVKQSVSGYTWLLFLGLLLLLLLLWLASLLHRFNVPSSVGNFIALESQEHMSAWKTFGESPSSPGHHTGLRRASEPTNPRSLPTFEPQRQKCVCSPKTGAAYRKPRLVLSRSLSAHFSRTPEVKNKQCPRQPVSLFVFPFLYFFSDYFTGDGVLARGKWTK